MRFLIINTLFFFTFNLFAQFYCNTLTIKDINNKNCVKPTTINECAWGIVKFKDKQHGLYVINKNYINNKDTYWYVFYKPFDLNGNIWYRDSVLIPEENGKSLFDLGATVVSAYNIDNFGSLWFGTGTYGYFYGIDDIYSYRGDTYLFKYKNKLLEYYKLPKINIIKTKNKIGERIDSSYHKITNIAVDKYNNIWMAAHYVYYAFWSEDLTQYFYKDSTHLYKFNGKTWKLFDKNSLSLKKDFYIRGIVCDKSNNIWVATDSGLYRFTEDSLKAVYTINNTNLPANKFNCLYLDKNDKLWFSVVNNNSISIGNFDGSAWSIIKHSINGEIFDMTFDNNENLWFTGNLVKENKLYILGKLNDSTISYYNVSTTPLDHTISALLKIDTSNNFFLFRYDDDLIKCYLHILNNNCLITDNNFKEIKKTNIFFTTPNPFTDRIQISIDQADSKASFYKIGIYDLTGREIKSFNYKDIPQTGNIAIDCPDLPCGIYIIRLQTDKAVYAGKLIKE